MIDLQAVISFAREKHEGQLRAFTNENFFEGHVTRVADLVKKYSDNPILITAAYLHDVVEDTNTSIEEVKSLFGAEVASVVLSLTNNEELMEKKGRAKYMLGKMLNMSVDELLVKLCDRLDNITGLENCPKKFMRLYALETRFFIDNLCNSHCGKNSIVICQLVGEINNILDKTKF